MEDRIGGPLLPVSVGSDDLGRFNEKNMENAPHKPPQTAKVRLLGSENSFKLPESQIRLLFP